MTLSETRVLRVDTSGTPLEWINYQQAAKLYYGDQVVYNFGALILTLHGGWNARTGLRSSVQVHAVIATSGHSGHYRTHHLPLTNSALFRRDNYICMYCGDTFPTSELSRDHIQPLSQGGKDTWNNVVTACKRCNHHKSSQTPEEAGMELLAVPFIPTHAEYIYLQERRVMADQMTFLKAHFPRKSPLRSRSH